MQTIEVDPEPAEAVEYTLTATLTDEKGKAYEIDGQPVSISFNRSLQAFGLNTYAEYLAACQANNGAGSTDQITIKAYVIGVVCMSSSSAGSLYLQDADGHGYYAYAPVDSTKDCETDAQLRAKWPVGTEVVVTGTVTTYNGQYEFNKGCEVRKTGNTVTDAELPYVDATTAFAAATSNEDTALAEYQNRRVTLKDAIVTKIDATGEKGTSSYKAYYYFTLPGSDVEFNVYYTIYFIDDATASAVCDKLVVGKKVDLTGIISVYSKDFQVYPDSANSVSNVRDVEYTDAEKVAMAKENLVITDSAKKDDVIELPAEGALGTTIAWAFAEGKSYEGLATLADGKLTITGTPDETTRIELVATITSGEASDTKNFEVKVYGAVIDWKVTADALETCDALEDGATSEDFYYFYGTVGEIYNTEYCNFYLLDAEGNSIVVYGLYAPNGTDRYGSKRQIAEIPFKEGDLICMRAQVQRYVKNGSITPELVNAVHVETPAKGTEVFVAYNATEAVAICDALENGATTEDFFYFSGVVGEIYNTEYCNFYLTDANGGSIVVYGLYAPNGTDRYGSKRQIAEIPFKEGDLICMRAQVQKYVKNDNITPELVNAVLVSFSAPSVPVHTCESKCAVCGGCEDAACTEEACTTKCNCVAQDAPEAGTYVLKLVHTNLENKALYFTGAMDGHYFATTEVEAEAIQVVLAKLENGKYTMAITVEGATKYLAIVKSGTYINVVMQDAAAEWTWNAKLGNFTIDVDGTAYFYGTSSTGTYTTISQRKLSDASTTCQAKLVALSGGSTGGETPDECTNLCATCGKCLDEDCTQHAEKCEGHTITTIAGALAGKEGDKATFTGMVSGIYQNWDSYYGNMSVYVSDDQGNRIIVFRTTTQVGVGDIVTVSGTITIYQATGVAQIAQGSTVTIDTVHECSEFTPATCLSAKICTVCGKADGEPLEHTDAADSNGKCDLCGEDMQSAAAQVTVTAKYTGTTTGNMTTGNNAATIGLDATIFNVTSAKPNGGNNLVGLNKAGNMRLYKDNTCTMTIAIAEGYQIVSIKVTLAASSKTAGNLVVTNGTDTLTAENGLYMISGSTVVFSNSGSDQVHIASIEIVYAPAAQ